jgi:hypothetical protein
MSRLEEPHTVYGGLNPQGGARAAGSGWFPEGGTEMGIEPRYTSGRGDAQKRLAYGQTPAASSQRQTNTARVSGQLCTRARSQFHSAPRCRRSPNAQGHPSGSRSRATAVCNTRRLMTFNMAMR